MRLRADLPTVPVHDLTVSDRRYTCSTLTAEHAEGAEASDLNLPANRSATRAGIESCRTADTSGALRRARRRGSCQRSAEIPRRLLHFVEA